MRDEHKVVRSARLGDAGPTDATRAQKGKYYPRHVTAPRTEKVGTPARAHPSRPLQMRSSSADNHYYHPTGPDCWNISCPLSSSDHSGRQLADGG